MPSDRLTAEFASELAAMFGQRPLRRGGVGLRSSDPNSPNFDPHYREDRLDASDANTREVPVDLGVTTPADSAQASVGSESGPKVAEIGTKSDDFSILRAERADDSLSAPNSPVFSPNSPNRSATDSDALIGLTGAPLSNLGGDRDDSTNRSPDGPIAVGRPQKRKVPREAAPKRPQGGQPIVESWYDLLTDAMADGTSMRRAATRIGMRLTAYECKQLQKRKVLREMYQRKRRAHSEKKFKKLQAAWERQQIDAAMRQSQDFITGVKRELGLPEDY